jgi:hypothetical protein
VLLWGSLQQLEIHSLLKNYPLICKKVIRNDASIGEYVGGKRDGIMYPTIGNQQVEKLQQA